MRPLAGKRRCALGGRQRGFSLVAAVFLIVVLAALGAFAVQIAMMQYQGADVELLEARAQAAAQTGIEYAAYVALTNSSCGNATLNPQGALSGFVVNVTCSAATHTVGAGLKTVYTLVSNASHGTYGQPDYVARRVTLHVTDAPP